MKKMISLFVEKLRILNDIFKFCKKLLKYNASLNTYKDREKCEYTLLRKTHIIEKGMSFRNPKHGFGQEKVESLLDDLNVYLDLYGKCDFFNYPISAISNYLEYSQKTGVEVRNIANKLSDIKKKLNFYDNTLYVQSGVETKKRDYILSHNKDFKDVLYNRHSIRYFSNELVPKSLLEEALGLAQRTPSACNRQGWKTHIYFGDDAVSLIKWQGGSRGFEDEIRCAILVTANLKAFLSHEIHQAYIDGGLYAMNLINALTYLGLGNIPLSCGFHETHLEELVKFNIPENEVPIVIIGVGFMEENVKVAISKRKTVEQTNTFESLESK